MYQKSYIESVLDLFNMRDCAQRETPTESGVKLSKGDPVTKNRPYRALVGSLLYVLGSRPDVASAIRACSQYCAQGADKHWKAAKTILRYLSHTVAKGV